MEGWCILTSLGTEPDAVPLRSASRERSAPIVEPQWSRSESYPRCRGTVWSQIVSSDWKLNRSWSNRVACI
ncbi:hypothetical protein SKAU_G00354550 [Synaphobranchus kaupii]|uniref:Uncharacterized protein n=1 Tax=Synaphobranchus kaupii TaxID=118154 RepID=A0A9Q1IGH2_SYNKA|nr:hypothetical protein SKAU_G00354550 [Synaphobranchus kaupii]